jgi:hypothetical protein
MILFELRMKRRLAIGIFLFTTQGAFGVTDFSREGFAACGLFLSKARALKVGEGFGRAILAHQKAPDGLREA